MTLPTPYYQSPCGRYTLYHGDCLAILPHLPSGSVDLCLCDPPYGHNNNNGDLIHRIEQAIPRRRTKDDDGTRVYEARPIANDGAEANDLFRACLPDLFRLLQPGCCCCCCCGGGGGPDPQFARWSLWLDEVFDFKQMVVWDKGPMGMGWHYRRSYETVLVAEKPGAACRWFDESSAVENIIRPHTNGITKIIPQADDHPTPKPWQLAAHFIRLHTRPDNVVLDPFAGYGWVGVACAKMGRKYVGIEIDEGFCAEAARRIEAERNHLFAETMP